MFNLTLVGTVTRVQELWQFMSNMPPLQKSVIQLQEHTYRMTE